MTSSLQIYSGTLMFTGSGFINPLKQEEYKPRPWNFVLDDDGVIDIHPIITASIQALNNRPAQHERGVDFYSLKADPASRHCVVEADSGHPLLKSRNPPAWSNLNAYLNSILQWLTARKILLEVSENGFCVKADERETVFLVEGVDSTDNCPIADEVARDICGVEGETGRCIFSSGMKGTFCCHKFSDVIARRILDNHATGHLRPQWTRIGNCGYRVAPKA